MTSQQIERRREVNFKHYTEGYAGEFRDDALWEIALQLAHFNERMEKIERLYAASTERNRIMFERWMEMTAPAVKKKHEARSKKPEASPNS